MHYIEKIFITLFTVIYIELILATMLFILDWYKTVEDIYYWVVLR